jgi:hypothetical protein
MRIAIDQNHPTIKYVWEHGEVTAYGINLPQYTRFSIEDHLQKGLARNLLTRRKAPVELGSNRMVWFYQVAKNVRPDDQKEKSEVTYIGGEPDYAYYLRNFFRGSSDDQIRHP